LAYTSNILLAWKHSNWGWHFPEVATYSDCRLQTSAGIVDWAKLMCTPIR